MSPQRRVVITVKPSGKHDAQLTVDDALRQVLDFLRVAEDAKASLGRVQEDFEWVLHSASTNTPFTLVAIARPLNAGVDIAPHVVAVKEVTARAFHIVRDGGSIPGWLSPKGSTAMREFFSRNANGVGATTVALEGTDSVEIDHDQAVTVAPHFELETVALRVPARTAYGEIDGRLVAVGRYRNRPALFLRTALYGNVWCVLGESLIDRWGDQQKVSDVWKGKRLTVFGRLIYWTGGRLSRVEAESVREKAAPPIDIASILDPDFTAGLDPVEYLNRLHEGELG